MGVNVCDMGVNVWYGGERVKGGRVCGMGVEVKYGCEGVMWV